MGNSFGNSHHEAIEEEEEDHGNEDIEDGVLEEDRGRK